MHLEKFSKGSYFSPVIAAFLLLSKLSEVSTCTTIQCSNPLLYIRVLSCSGCRINVFLFLDLVSDDDVKAFFAESLIMKDFDHPNVLRLLGVCLDAPDGHPYIVLPFMSYGNLRDYLRSRRVHLTDVNTYPKVKKNITPSW